jgi:hypothetical protein
MSIGATKAAKLTWVGYDVGEELVTRFTELKCLSITTPNRHMFGYIVLCIALVQNLWLARLYSK